MTTRELIVGLYRPETGSRIELGMRSFGAEVGTEKICDVIEAEEATMMRQGWAIFFRIVGESDGEDGSECFGV